MRLYHSTSDEAASAILAGGFRDATGSYMFAGMELTGVFLAPTPSNVNDGARGNTLLVVEINLSEGEAAAYAIQSQDPETGEWDEPTEYIMPAEVINRRASVRMATDDDEAD